MNDIMPTPFMDPERARAAAAKGHATQSRLFAAKRAAKAAAKLAPPAQPPAKPPEQLPQPVILPPAVITADDGYRHARLERTRRQIELLDGMMTNAKTPLDVDKITNSLRRLYEVEADLAGRPGRGNRKPPAERPQRREAPRTGLIVEPTGPLAPCPWDPQQPPVNVKAEPITPTPQPQTQNGSDPAQNGSCVI